MNRRIAFALVSLLAMFAAAEETWTMENPRAWARDKDAIKLESLSDGGIEVREFSLPWVANPVSTHGTGCSLAAALAAELALGSTLVDAVEGAKRYVRAAIAGSHLVGPECGVLGFVKDVQA